MTSVLLAVAAGGALGAGARAALSLAWPAAPGAVPWATLLANLTGSLLLGMLMVAVLEVWPARRLARPFLGVGLLGGYTTFSAFALETVSLTAAGRPLLAASYAAGSVVAGLAAMAVGTALVRAVTRR